MLNVVYLVLIMYSSGNKTQVMESVQIPQANIDQCQVNKKSYAKDPLVIRSYCIVGVMPK